VCTSAHGKHRNNGKILPAPGPVRVTLKVHKVALRAVSFPPCRPTSVSPSSIVTRTLRNFPLTCSQYYIILAIEKVLNSYQMHAKMHYDQYLLYMWPELDSSLNVMSHGDVREGKWRGNWRMEWVASTLHTTSEHGVSSITTADAHTSAASSRLNWRPCRFKWTRLFRRKTKCVFLRMYLHVSNAVCHKLCFLDERFQVILQSLRYELWSQMGRLSKCSHPWTGTALPCHLSTDSFKVSF
jgi:hypothetical protein